MKKRQKPKRGPVTLADRRNRREAFLAARKALTPGDRERLKIDYLRTFYGPEAALGSSPDGTPENRPSGTKPPARSRELLAARKARQARRMASVESGGSLADANRRIEEFLKNAKGRSRKR